jgi:hypothetical protein
MLIDHLGGAETMKTLVQTTSANITQLYTMGFVVSPTNASLNVHTNPHTPRFVPPTHRVLMLVNKGNRSLRVSLPRGATGKTASWVDAEVGHDDIPYGQRVLDQDLITLAGYAVWLVDF